MSVYEYDGPDQYDQDEPDLHNQFVQRLFLLTQELDVLARQQSRDYDEGIDDSSHALVAASDIGDTLRTELVSTRYGFANSWVVSCMLTCSQGRRWRCATRCAVIWCMY